MNQPVLMDGWSIHQLSPSSWLEEIYVRVRLVCRTRPVTYTSDTLVIPTSAYEQKIAQCADPTCSEPSAIGPLCVTHWQAKQDRKHANANTQ